MTITIIIFALILIDQITKYLIRINFQEGETLPIISDIFHLTYVRNRGAAFSIFENIEIVTILIPIVIIILTIAFLIYYKNKISKVMLISISLIISGGLSNLIDRVIFGYVTDMIDFRFFPVFNIADIAVTIGCILIIISLFIPFKGDNDKVEGINGYGKRD